MKDILLTRNGDLFVNEAGDIAITDSVRQSVRIRLLWFFGEWRFAPQYGVPYFEAILVKNPDIERIRRIIRDEVMSVDEVLDVNRIQIQLDKPVRHATVTMEITLAEETYKEEVIIDVGLRGGNCV